MNFGKAESGVIPRAIEQVFARAKSEKAAIFCSFLQIYNEKIYDLLQVIHLPFRTPRSQSLSVSMSLRSKASSSRGSPNSE